MKSANAVAGEMERSERHRGELRGTVQGGAEILTGERVVKDQIRKLVSMILWDAKAIQISDEEPYRLTSGKMSPIYIDCRRMISFPVYRDMITSFAYWFYVNEGLDADYIAGGESAGIPYGSWLAQRLGLPFIYVRKEAKGHGLSAQIEGAIEQGRTVLLYEDLITDGKSKINFISGITRAQCTVKACLVVFDRLQGGGQTLEEQGVQLYSITDLDTALEVGSKIGALTQEGLRSVREYLDDPRDWHAARGLPYDA